MSVNDNSPTEQQWEDEFLKIDGPELIRTPIRFASKRQLLLSLFKATASLQNPGSGLVTPIEVEKYNNGVRILFRPKISSYSSSKEEKQQQQQQQ